MNNSHPLRTREEIQHKINELDLILELNSGVDGERATRRRSDILAKKKTLLWVLGEYTDLPVSASLLSTP